MLALLAACQHDTADTSGAFYNWDDRKVHCAIDLDTYARNDLASVITGLDRARERGEVVELYAHDPGHSVSWDELEAVLAAVHDRDLPYFTYADFAHGVTPGPGVAISFDDTFVGHWLDGADLYARYGARLTFFVAHFPSLTATQRADLHELSALGHTIEAHSIHHERAPTYVERNGLRAYLDDEAVPSIDLLRAEGFEVTTYAYPFGARTDELDAALLQHVAVLRSVAFTWTSPATDPCPN